MELLNGLYKLDSDRLNIILRKNTGRKKVVYEKIFENIIPKTTDEDEYETLGYFTTLNQALKFLHEYHIKTKLDGLNDIERIIEVFERTSAEVLKAIENIKDSDLDIIYMKK